MMYDQPMIIAIMDNDYFSPVIQIEKFKSDKFVRKIRMALNLLEELWNA